jgi:RNA polymerase sigma-70 factor (ECF subfamily)
MNDATAFAAYFLAVRPDVTASPELGLALRAAFAAGAEAFPEFELAAEAFVRFVAPKLPAVAGPPDRALAALHVSDLYLACACVLGDPRAHARLEQLCEPAVERAARRLGPEFAYKAELRQRLRERLLAPRPGGDGPPLPPRVADFSGESALGTWVHVIAVREAIEIVRRRGREDPTDDDDLARRLEPEQGPELAYFKQLYGAEFKAAFAEALASLEKRERALLRQHALDGLSIDRLAALYGIHRATAARRVEAARRAVFARTRESLRRRLNLSGHELDSVMRLALSRLDVSFSSLLREQEGPEGPERGDPPPGPGSGGRGPS